MSIVSFDDGNGTKEFCNDTKYCGGLLIQLKNGDRACTLCERIYPVQSTVLHKKKLIVDDDDGEPLLVLFSEYDNKKKKAPTPGEVEDQYMCSKKSGLSIISVEETHYDV